MARSAHDQHARLPRRLPQQPRERVQARQEYEPHGIDNRQERAIEDVRQQQHIHQRDGDEAPGKGAENGPHVRRERAPSERGVDLEMFGRQRPEDRQTQRHEGIVRQRMHLTAIGQTLCDISVEAKHIGRGAGGVHERDVGREQARVRRRTFPDHELTRTCLSPPDAGLPQTGLTIIRRTPPGCNHLAGRRRLPCTRSIAVIANIMCRRRGRT